ncbi:MAG TPA: hypothetical protein VGG45_04505 [Terracidiphilus sp.]|jgi:hypothetical protein
MTRLPRILCAVPQLPHVHLEIAKAIQTLWGQENEQTANRFVAKAAVDDPEHPGWPAHTPDRKGGEFRPKDGAFDSSSSVPGNGPRNEATGDVRVAMEPAIDPATGQPFSSETPLDRLGGGEGPGGGGGLGERSTSGSSEAATADAQGAGPPQIGAFTPPDNLTYGTTLFGNYAHEKIADLLGELYPGVTFKFRVLPGQRGIDVTVPNKSVGRVGYQFGEIKPRTPSGESAFNRQLQQWGVGPVQSISYDAAGNVYYGFH